MASTVVFPITANFDADGTADLKQVMQEKVDIVAADYDLFIGDASSNALFTAFAIAEGTSDGSADVVVTTVNEAAVKEAIKYALQNALGGAGATSAASGETLKTLMQAYVKTQVEADLATSGLLNILEAEELLNVDISNAVIGSNGSAAMWGAINSASAAVKAVMATQLPYEKYASIPDGGNLDAAFEAGDKMVLRFQLSSKLTVKPQKEDVTGAEGADANVAAQPAFDSTVKSRTLNIHFTKAA